MYCEYNTLKDVDKESDINGNSDSENSFREREPNTPEEQLLHFLAQAGRQGWKWMSVSTYLIFSVLVYKIKSHQKYFL